jgi:hypothetical protein
MGSVVNRFDGKAYLVGDDVNASPIRVPSVSRSIENIIGVIILLLTEDI